MRVSSELKDRKKDKKISELDLHLMIETSVNCNFNSAPFENDEFNIHYLELTSTNTQRRTKIKVHKTNEKGENGIVIETYNDRKKKIDLQIVTQNGEVQYQYFHDRKSGVHKEYTKHTDNLIIKIIKDTKSTTTVIKERNTLSEYFTDEVNNIRKHCIKKANGDIINTTLNLENNETQTAVLQENGQWFNASGYGSKIIIMGMNNYINSIEQPNRENEKMHNMFIKKGVYLQNASKSKRPVIGNNIDVEIPKSDGRISSTKMINYDIINEDCCILINKYHQYLHIVGFSTYSKEFKKISSLKELHLDFLYYTTCDGIVFRTSNSNIIKKFKVKNEDSILGDCGELKFLSEDSNKNLKKWLKSYGTLEHNQFVKTSKNILDLGTVYVYTDGLNKIMWKKST